MMEDLPMPPTEQVVGRSDLIGIINTSACVAHCVSLPILVSIGATFMLHPVVTWVFVLIALFSVIMASRYASRAWVRVLLWSALVLFAVSILLEEHHVALEAVSYFASALLVVGHVINRRHYRTCSH